MYNAELTLKKAYTNIMRNNVASSIDILNGKLNTNMHDKRDKFSFPIVNYTF